MGILQELEGMKYRFVSDLITSEEQYDKKRNVISAYDAYNMCYDRYLLLQNILLPLKTKLGNRVDVTDIKFVSANDDEKGLIVNYIKDNTPYFLSISNIDYEDISVIGSDIRVRNSDFVDNNRGIIIETFRNISNESLDEDITLKSTTGKFIIIDNCDKFMVSDLERKVFSTEGRYSNYGNSNSLSNPSSLVCNFPKLKELLLVEENVLALYKNIHIYEADLPKELIKKLT